MTRKVNEVENTSFELFGVEHICKPSWNSLGESEFSIYILRRHEFMQAWLIHLNLVSQYFICGCACVNTHICTFRILRIWAFVLQYSPINVEHDILSQRYTSGYWKVRSLVGIFKPFRKKKNLLEPYQQPVLHFSFTKLQPMSVPISYNPKLVPMAETSLENCLSTSGQC